MQGTDHEDQLVPHYNKQSTAIVHSLPLISSGFLPAAGAPRQANHRFSCTTANSEGSLGMHWYVLFSQQPIIANINI